MEEKEVQRVLARISEAEQWRDANYGDMWRDCYRRYRSQVKNEREGSNLFVPHTFMQCEVIKARINESLFASRPYLSALPREGNDVAHAEKMQTLLDWQLNERMDLPRLIGEIVAAGVIIYGTGVTYTGWQLKTRRVKKARYEEKTLLGEKGLALAGADFTVPVQQVVDEEEVLYDDPVVANIPLEEFYCDTRADSIENARFCGHREYMTRAMLEDLERQEKYVIDWEKLDVTDEDDDAKGEDSFVHGDRKGLYLVHHYWEDERHLVFVNRSQCVCEEENPFWHGMKPYDKTCFVSLPGEFYGVGVPELLAGLQDELNTSRNQRIDYSSMVLRRMWKLRRGCGLTARDLVWRQNGVLQVENMDDVQEINIQGLPSAAFSNEASVKQDMQDVTGCYDILLGLSYVNETATTTMTRDNNASLRFKVVVRALIKDLLVPIAKKCVALDQQFLSAARALRVLGEPVSELFSVSPEELTGDYDVIYCGTAIESMANKELVKERSLQAYSLALADPAYQNDDEARLKLFQKVLDALEIKDSTLLLPKARNAQPADTAAIDESRLSSLAAML